MKLNAGKRILMFFHWLFSLAACAALVGVLLRPDWMARAYARITRPLSAVQLRLIGAALLTVYVMLAAAQLCLILRRQNRHDRGLITVDSSETGKVRIAVAAIEQMVRQSVYDIDGIADMKIRIDNQDDAIGIGISASILSGSHVPTITMNMQRAIRQFVEMNCGVAVRTVSVSINAVTAPGESGHRHRRGRGDALPVAVAPVAQTAQAVTETAEPEAVGFSEEPVEEATAVSDDEIPETSGSFEGAEDAPAQAADAPLADEIEEAPDDLYERDDVEDARSAASDPSEDPQP